MGKVTPIFIQTQKLLYITLLLFQDTSTVIYFGTNQKHKCDFLLVRHSNHGPILHRFGNSSGFCAHDPTPIPP